MTTKSCSNTHIDNLNKKLGGKSMKRENVVPLVGNVIRVDRGGPESSIGLLLSAGDDHVSVLVEDWVYQVKQDDDVNYVSEEEAQKNGDNNNEAIRYKDYSVIYYQTQHIKSISSDAKKNFNSTIAAPENLEYIQKQNFKGVLEDMKYQWVKINRGGPEKIEGILFEINDDFITVTKNEEIVRLSMFHVRSLSYSVLRVEDPIPTENSNSSNDSSDVENKEEK
jgi:spore coat protein B